MPHADVENLKNDKRKRVSPEWPSDTFLRGLKKEAIHRRRGLWWTRNSGARILNCKKLPTETDAGLNGGLESFAAITEDLKK